LDSFFLSLVFLLAYRHTSWYASYCYIFLSTNHMSFQCHHLSLRIGLDMYMLSECELIDTENISLLSLFGLKECVRIIILNYVIFRAKIQISKPIDVPYILYFTFTLSCICASMCMGDMQFRWAISWKNAGIQIYPIYKAKKGFGEM
jgi:hypothetical protein